MGEDMLGISAADAVEMAIQMECDGERFYRQAADAVQGHEEVHRLMVRLALDEQQHSAVFRTMLESMGSEPWFIEGIDGDEEATRFIRDWVAEQVHGYTVADSDELVYDFETPYSTLTTAIALERRTIAFYENLLELVADGQGREWVEKIIDQEHRHVAILRKARERTT